MFYNIGSRLDSAELKENSSKSFLNFDLKALLNVLIIFVGSTSYGRKPIGRLTL